MPHYAELDDSPISTDTLVGTGDAADCEITGPMIRRAAMIDFCDMLQKLDMAGFLA